MPSYDLWYRNDDPLWESEVVKLLLKTRMKRMEEAEWNVQWEVNKWWYHKRLAIVSQIKVKLVNSELSQEEADKHIKKV